MTLPNKRIRILTYLKTQHQQRLEVADAIQALKIAPIVGHYERQIKTILKRKRRAERKGKPKPVQGTLDFTAKPKRRNLTAKRAKRKKKVKKLIRKRNGKG